ncbi:putative FAD dependent oxidoreductase [Delitschia confertaspora ATCC 74209]|uniref:FAD dependent oxidoreductase n=1 Tax=Delitschia confertaspora ATCC 74209 TaxID=1513339 RepID=A0A9P4MYA7_9PLEO|nr:putative FAD dependent oxidoreductase [Delitschia confertaspora ATCC 74209]
MKTSILLSSLVSGLVPFTCAAGIKDQFDESNYAKDFFIERDVAVIGGGASGTYGAINLKSLQKSVVLVEREGVLGGHTNTWHDIATGVDVDYGVQAFLNIPTVRDYFTLLGVTSKSLSFPPQTRSYVDFQTAQLVTGVKSNLTGYYQQLSKYPWISTSWNLPTPVPEDLLLPFGDFIRKYNLQDAAYGVYFTGQGFANILDQLTINVFKFVLDTSASGLPIVPATNNSEIYVRAATSLGKDVLLSSTIVAAKRPSNDDDSGIYLVVKTPSGFKLIKAKKLLISIPPLLDNMRPFGLDNTETSLFSQWSYTDYYTMLVKNTGLPSGFQFANANSAAETFHIPQLPAPYQITETRIPGLFYVWYGSPNRLTEAQVKSDVTTVIGRLTNGTENKPEFVEFRSHTPFKLVVSKENILGGFYDRLESLQGHRDTWYTGAAFSVHQVGILWNFTQTVVQQIVKT